MDSRVGRAGPFQAGVQLLLIGRRHQIGGLDHALHQHPLTGPHREDDFAGKAIYVARDASGVVLGRDLDEGHGAPACSGNEGSTLQSAPRKALPQNIPKFSRRSTSENRGFPMRRVIVAGVIGLLAACGNPAAPEMPFVGTFGLQSINHQGLPFVIQQTGTGSVSITKDVLVVSEDGTWAETGYWKSTSAGSVVTVTSTSSDGGTWIRSGNSLSLVSTGQSTPTYAGTFDRSTLTMTDGTFALVFVK